MSNLVKRSPIVIMVCQDGLSRQLGNNWRRKCFLSVIEAIFIFFIYYNVILQNGEDRIKKMHIFDTVDNKRNCISIWLGEVERRYEASSGRGCRRHLWLSYFVLKSTNSHAADRTYVPILCVEFFAKNLIWSSCRYVAHTHIIYFSYPNPTL